jgi:ABC-type sulfate transport system permease subunit
MAHTPSTSTLAPLTEEALYADRMAFWGAFTSASFYAIIAVVALMVGMWLFLV